ncbi:MAG: hypothetical protein WDZ40_01890 [Candidatus Spechtbacterales bacterium]
MPLAAMIRTDPLQRSEGEGVENSLGKLTFCHKKARVQIFRKEVPSILHEKQYIAVLLVLLDDHSIKGIEGTAEYEYPQVLGPASREDLAIFVSGKILSSITPSPKSWHKSQHRANNLLKSGYELAAENEVYINFVYNIHKKST